MLGCSAGVLTLYWAVPQVELLSWKSANDIAGDGGLEKVTEKEGTGWDTPKDLDEVRGEEG